VRSTTSHLRRQQSGAKLLAQFRYHRQIHDLYQVTLPGGKTGYYLYGRTGIGTIEKQMLDYRPYNHNVISYVSDQLTGHSRTQIEQALAMLGTKLE
jgi:hypothetical protein